MTRMEAVEWVVVEAVLVVAPALDAHVVGLIGAHLVVVVDLVLVVRADQVALVGSANRVLATRAQAALVGLGTPVQAVLATLVQALAARVSLVVPVLLAALVGGQVQVDQEALVALGVIQMVLVMAVLGNNFLKVRRHFVFLPFFYINFLFCLKRLVLYKYDCLLGLFSVYFVLSWEKSDISENT